MIGLPPAGYFLVPNKKVTKEIGIRGASGKCAPLCIPRRFIEVPKKLEGLDGLGCQKVNYPQDKKAPLGHAIYELARNSKKYGC